MGEKERIKMLRVSQKLNQTDFGHRIDLTTGAISDIERGKCAVTDRTRRTICREFGVSETWLRTGEGEMFLPKEDVDLSEYAKANGITPAEENVIRAWLAFPADKRREVVEHLRRYLSANAPDFFSGDSAVSVEAEREETPEERHERHKREARAEADELYEVILQEKMEMDNPDVTFGSNSSGGGVA